MRSYTRLGEWQQQVPLHGLRLLQPQRVNWVYSSRREFERALSLTRHCLLWPRYKSHWGHLAWPAIVRDCRLYSWVGQAIVSPWPLAWHPLMPWEPVAKARRVAQSLELWLWPVVSWDNVGAGIVVVLLTTEPSPSSPSFSLQLPVTTAFGIRVPHRNPRNKHPDLGIRRPKVSCLS